MSLSVLLIINSGSSSIKFQLLSNSAQLHCLALGKVSNLGTSPLFQIQNDSTQSTPLPLDYTPDESLQFILNWIDTHKPDCKIQAVAHRVVHGGDHFTQPVVVTLDILNQLKQLNALAPLHQPQNLMAIEIIKQHHPDLLQIACFDTAFHAEHSALFKAYALPKFLREEGIKRYGFHGLSYEWIARVLQEEHPVLAKGRVVAAHLGNGASLCALLNGKSIDTTMGLTALDGVPMGTRCGSLDPGAVIYMIRNLGLSPDKTEHILYNESGLLGLSGISNDVHTLETSLDEKAAFALDYFCLKTAQLIGMMAIALGGMDTLVFTGGIGENSEFIRSNILKRIECLGPFSTLVIAANEEKMMALHTLALLKSDN